MTLDPDRPTRLARALREAWTELEQALYPPLCWLCRRARCVEAFGCSEHALGPTAFDPDEARCGGCAGRLPRGVRDGPCAECRRRPRGFRSLRAAAPYRPEGVLAQWILAFKHGGRAELAGPLAAFLARELLRGGPIPAGVLLVSVPLHVLRRVERGYDQAGLLARALAGELDRSYVRALRRRRWTAPQGAPGARSRAVNVSEAFVVPARLAKRLQDRSLWLVDDVVTSGATVRACAEVLRRAGAREVAVVALARAEHERAP